MVLTRENTEYTLKTLPESIFYDEISPVQGSIFRKPTLNVESIVDFSLDSYIIGFCGHRGAGKNIFMTFLGLKAAWLYDMKLLANYPMGCRTVDGRGRSRVIQAEPIDVARMLEFSDEYENCIICLQEAPTIINRMAAVTWKNRLLNLWLQEIRHSRCTLIYESQNPFWVDGELQWQTDVLGFVNDASRRYPGSGLARGGIVLASFRDKSGMWTGHPWDERPIPINKYLEAQPIWGCYDTYYKGDIWESLRKVDLKLSKYTINRQDSPPEENYKTIALEVIRSLRNDPESTPINRKEFYNIIPDMNEGDKARLSQAIFKAGTKSIPRDNRGDVYLDFREFDEKKFLEGA